MFVKKLINQHLKSLKRKKELGPEKMTLKIQYIQATNYPFLREKI